MEVVERNSFMKKMNTENAVDYCSHHSNCVIRTKTEDAYNKLMTYLNNHNFEWMGIIGANIPIHESNIFNKYNEETCIFFPRSDKTIAFGKYSSLISWGYAVIEIE